MSGSQLATSYFVLTLDIPFKVVFQTPAALVNIDSITSETHTRTVSTVNPTTAHCATRRRDVIMSRDRTSASCAGGGHSLLCRPRSRSVCTGKYCSVGGGQRVTDSVVTTGQRSVTGPRRPHSAACRPRLTANHRHCGTTALRRHPHQHQQHDDAQTSRHLDPDNSGVTTATSGGVVTSADDDVIATTASRDTWPGSEEGGEARRRESGVMSMSDSDRQSQLRRFLDAVNRHSSSSSSSSTTTDDQQHSDVSGDVSDDDDDDVCESESRRGSAASVSEFFIFSSFTYYCGQLPFDY